MQLTMMLLMKIKKYWILFSFAFLASVVSGGTFTAWGYLAAQGLRSLMVSPHRQTHASHRQWGFYTTGALLIVSFTLIFVFTARAGAQFTEDLRKKCIKALLYADMAFFDVNSSGELSSKLGTDCR
jgi:ABC-type multidrug transport system fused ATPase/permease subunit